jgi:hypothetical protein
MHMTNSDEPEVWLDESEIICVRFPKNSRITLDTISTVYKKHRAISDKKHAVLFLASGVVHYDVAAADFASNTNVSEITSALALVGGSFLSNHLGNMLVWYHKPPFPVKLFTDEAKARSWLSAN